VAFAALLTAVLLYGGATRAAEDDAPQVLAHGSLRIQDAWLRSAIGSHEAKIFFSFRNVGEPDRLVGASSVHSSEPASLRAVSVDEDGRTVARIDAIPLPKTDILFELSEVGYYVELTGIEVPLVMGSSLPVTLAFERAGPLRVDITNRFHAPSVTRRIRKAVEENDLETLRALRGASPD
jgi:copper(I)-binding protein